MQDYREVLGSSPTLYTPRFVLRQPVEKDIPAIVAIVGDWEIARRLRRMPHPYSEEDARFFLTEIVPVALTWAIADRSSDQMVGAIGLAPREDEQASLEIGYYVAREHWGRGIATEAASVVTAYGVGLVGQDRLTSTFFADNPASGRVLERLGFVPVGTAEEPCLASGGTVLAVKVRLGSSSIRTIE